MWPVVDIRLRWYLVTSSCRGLVTLHTSSHVKDVWRSQKHSFV